MFHSAPFHCLHLFADINAFAYSFRVETAINMHHRARITWQYSFLAILLQFGCAVPTPFDALQPDPDQLLHVVVLALNDLLHLHMRSTNLQNFAYYDCAQSLRAATQHSSVLDSVLNQSTGSAQYVRYYEKVIPGRLTNVMLVDGVACFQ